MKKTLSPQRIQIGHAPPVYLTRLPGEEWMLLDDYVISMTLEDGAAVVIEIPYGFRFDLASVPRWLWWIIAPFELSLPAPLVHDALYRWKGVIDTPIPRVLTRKDADDIFLAIMESEEVSRWRRRSAYRAVRMFAPRW